MAVSSELIRRVNIEGTEYNLSARKLWAAGEGDNIGKEYTVEELLDLVGAGVQLVKDSKHSSKMEPATAASGSTMGKIYLVQDATSLTGAHVEFITVKTGESEPFTYSWEKIGTTEADLSNYATWGEYTSASAGAHTHTVSGNVTVPTIAKTAGKLSATATGTTVGVDGTVAAVTGFSGKHETDLVLGADTTFTATTTATKKNLKATASGADLTTTTETVVKSLGTPDTTNVVTKVPTLKTASFATDYNADQETDVVLGAATTFNVTGGAASTKNIKATASGTAVSAPTGKAIKTVTGATDTLKTASVKGVGGTTSVVASVSSTPTAFDNYTPSVSNGVLKFTKANKSVVASVSSSPATVATAAASATTVVTGLTGTGNTIVTGVSSTQGDYVTSVSISAQPTIALGEGSGVGSVAVVSGVSAVGVSANTNDNVTAVTKVATLAKGNAATAFKADGTSADVVSGFSTLSTAAVLKSASVKTQPTIKLAFVEGEDINAAKVAVDASTTVESDANDNVAAITALSAFSKENAAKGVKVTAQPTINLSATGETGIDFVKTVTIGSKTAALASGVAASAGAHTHTTNISKK